MEVEKLPKGKKWGLMTIYSDCEFLVSFLIPFLHFLKGKGVVLHNTSEFSWHDIKKMYS